MIDLTKLTPAPWESTNDAVPYSPKQKNSFSDCGASIYGLNGCEVVIGGAQDEQGGAVGVLNNEDAAFIALARNAFDVMMRHKDWEIMWIGEWCVVSFCDILTKELYGKYMKDNQQRFNNPFTAFVEADKWHQVNVEKL